MYKLLAFNIVMKSLQRLEINKSKKNYFVKAV